MFFSSCVTADGFFQPNGGRSWLSHGSMSLQNSHGSQARIPTAFLFFLSGFSTAWGASAGTALGSMDPSVMIKIVVWKSKAFQCSIFIRNECFSLWTEPTFDNPSASCLSTLTVWSARIHRKHDTLSLDAFIGSYVVKSGSCARNFIMESCQYHRS